MLIVDEPIEDVDKQGDMGVGCVEDEQLGDECIANQQTQQVVEVQESVVSEQINDVVNKGQELSSALVQNHHPMVTRSNVEMYILI
ncbi:hypothetical protein V6N13_124148 [Hibiscus sabdariffa]|uniref:Uncharacterized protein n=1 Tax=Hibiscus sabdariffa TaxID=183260 RepID=A0ABR2S0F5_9ROSI